MTAARRRTDFGLTWWGQRWLAALEALGAVYENRLPRGRTYARRGAVDDVVVQAGRVTARVQGSRARPYKVSVALPVVDDATWEAVIVALAAQVGRAAALLDGRMPEDVDEVVGACGASLFPRPGELEVTCSCPDWANPCKHAAAVCYVLATTFDADPFLLPELRGRDRTTLLAGIRAARSRGVTPEAPQRRSGPVVLEDLRASSLWYASGDGRVTGGDLGTVPVHPRPPAAATATLRSLGPPPAALGAIGEPLAELVQTAAEHAWRLASIEEPDVG